MSMIKIFWSFLLTIVSKLKLYKALSHNKGEFQKENHLCIVCRARSLLVYLYQFKVWQKAIDRYMSFTKDQEYAVIYLLF